MSAPMAKIFHQFSALNSVFRAVQKTSINYFDHVPALNQIFTRNTHGWVNWQMKKDVRKRGTVKEYSKTRMRLNAVRKNTILPLDIRELAHEEVDALPRDSNLHRVQNRCVMTSRARGNLRKWRMSRIVWRHLADYNKLPGVIRACW